jgi:hypothetical protein
MIWSSPVFFGAVEKLQAAVTLFRYYQESLRLCFSLWRRVGHVGNLKGGLPAGGQGIILLFYAAES